MAYLIHFNRNHNPKTGQFDFGDGDGDGQINERKLQKIENRDNRWAKRNYDRLMNKAYKPVRREMDKYVKKELNPLYAKQLREGKMSRSYMNDFNRKLAELMNQSSSSLVAPSGRIVKFVAKRGELGVHLALADADYDMSQLKKGVYGSGKIAYRKTHVNMQ